MALVIRNGRVIDPASGGDRVADVLIVEGKIAGVAPNLSAPGAEIFDATGMIVAPGFIDLHVHLREPGFEHAETIESGSRAAAAGCAGLYGRAFVIASHASAAKMIRAPSGMRSPASCDGTPVPSQRSW